TIWAALVRRNVTIPHEIALVTDMTEGLDPSIRVIPPPRDFADVMLPPWGPEKPQCLRRISMFRPDAAEVFGTERFVNMDLDVIVTGNLGALLSRDEDVVFFRGSSRSRPYN